MNRISIREFQHNLYKFIKSREDIVVTSKGKELFVVTFKQENVVTLPEIKENVVTKSRQETENVTTSAFCLPCLKAGFKKPSIGEFEVTFDDGEKRIALCEAHKRKFVNL